MAEQEPHKPQKPQSNTSQLIYGAVPALIGVIIVIAHLRRPLVSHDDQGILLVTCLALVGLSLTMWLYYSLGWVVKRVCAHFDQRHDAFLDELVRIRKKQRIICESLNSIDGRLEAIDGKLAIIEQQGVALGAAIIEEGLPTDGSWTRAN